jgi:hypothetical protein
MPLWCANTTESSHTLPPRIRFRLGRSNLVNRSAIAELSALDYRYRHCHPHRAMRAEEQIVRGGNAQAPRGSKENACSPPRILNPRPYRGYWDSTIRRFDEYGRGNPERGGTRGLMSLYIFCRKRSCQSTGVLIGHDFAREAVSKAQSRLTAPSLEKCLQSCYGRLLSRSQFEALPSI